MTDPVPLSLQDLAPISKGSSTREALARTRELATAADTLGYTRLWYAEHHGMPNIASSSPEVLIAHAAASTERIRIGAGGVMLPNHVPLRVVETYRTLEGLYPDRIDLGIGRAGGSDGRTLAALRSFGGEHFSEQFAELLAFETDRFPGDHPFREVKVVPAEVDLPPIWLLGSSGASAQLAGQQGLGYAFASHFSPTPPRPAFETYRQSFAPSDAFPEPHAILCVSAIVGETEEEAQWLAKSMELTWLRLRQGAPEAIAPPEEAQAYPWTERERAFVAEQSQLWIVGDAPSVAEEIRRRAEACGANEVMVTTTVHDYDKRLASYRMLAHTWGLPTNSE